MKTRDNSVSSASKEKRMTQIKNHAVLQILSFSALKAFSVSSHMDLAYNYNT